MRKSIWVIALLVSPILAPTVVRATITYNVDLTISNSPTATAIGNITTDGTIGTLSTANIVDWTLTLNDGTNTIALSPGNSFSNVVGGELTASTTSLMFDFSGSGSGYFYIFDNVVGPNFGYICFDDAFGACAGDSEAVVLGDLGNDGNYPAMGEPFSDQVIATVTPEPTTFSLMLTGIGLLGLMVTMRKRLPNLFSRSKVVANTGCCE